MKNLFMFSAAVGDSWKDRMKFGRIQEGPANYPDSRKSPEQGSRIPDRMKGKITPKQQQEVADILARLERGETIGGKDSYDAAAMSESEVGTPDQKSEKKSGKKKEKKPDQPTVQKIPYSAPPSGWTLRETYDEKRYGSANMAAKKREELTRQGAANVDWKRRQDAAIWGKYGPPPGQQ